MFCISNDLAWHCPTICAAFSQISAAKHYLEGKYKPKSQWLRILCKILDECGNWSQKMRENRGFSEVRRECVNERKMRELHAKCVILGRSAWVSFWTKQQHFLAFLLSIGTQKCTITPIDEYKYPALLYTCKPVLEIGCWQCC